MTYLFLDFETQSSSNLKKVDVVNYINDESTKVLCAAWYFTEDPLKFKSEDIGITWFDLPWDRIKDKTDLTVVAHNAFFEQAVIKRFFPSFEVHIGKWIDTMALASINNIRRGLEAAVQDCKIPRNKHKEGKFIMRRLNNSKNIITLDDLTQGELEQLAEYCRGDIHLTVALYNALISTFTKGEHKNWSLTNRQNWKGVNVDLELAEKGFEITKEWQEQLPEKVKKLTGGEVSSVNQVGKLAKFLKVPNITALFLRERLKIETDAKRVELIKLRLEGGKKSVSKYEAALNKSREGILYNTMDYHGAATGRFTSNGVQLQNLIKADKDTADAVIHKIKKNPVFNFDSTISAISKGIRGLFIPQEGYDLIKADYAQVEARILAWIVGDKELLDDFEKGGKVYEKMASAIYGIPLEEVTQEQRSHGKAAVLGCGYGMGAGKFQLTFRVNEEVSIKAIEAYRKRNQKVVKFWRSFEKLIKDTVKDGKTRKSQFFTLWRDSWRLFIKLPSGRNLVYPYPEIRKVETKFGEQEKVFHKTRKQARLLEESYWGGTFTENVCQAISRDLLCSAILALENDPTYSFLFTVHDELVYEAPILCYNTDDFERTILDSAPKWAKGLPLAVDIEVHNRYFK